MVENVYTIFNINFLRISDDFSYFILYLIMVRNVAQETIDNCFSNLICYDMVKEYLLYVI